MRLSAIAMTISMVSLTTAQGNWNCRNKDDPDARATEKFEENYPYGICINDAGLGLARKCQKPGPDLLTML
ncbi:hypothetical protein CFE70_006652 [Pyrenophora teres f. teres 0-1]